MDEYVYLFSNFNALKYFGRPNKIGDFRNQLNCYLPIQQNWKVALTEFIYTKSWYNVNKYHDVTLVEQYGSIVFAENCRIKPQFFPTPEKLCETINKILELFKIEKKAQLKYDPGENYVYLIPGKDGDKTYYPDLGEEIENILGLRNRNTFIYEYDVTELEDVKIDFKNVDIEKSDVIRGYHPVEIKAGIDFLCVYCDIVAESFAGDSKAQLLRLVEIPRKTNFNDTVHIRYQDRNYKRIYTDQFQSIRISVRDATNLPIDFKSGQCTALLHFVSPFKETFERKIEL